MLSFASFAGKGLGGGGGTVTGGTVTRVEGVV
jgi:hypothetical protein